MLFLNHPRSKRPTLKGNSFLQESATLASDQERLGSSLARHHEQEVRDFLADELSSGPRAHRCGGQGGGLSSGKVEGDMFQEVWSREQGLVQSRQSTGNVQAGQREIDAAVVDDARLRAWLDAADS